MKKFSFELEKILEFRNFEKQEAEAELAKAMQLKSNKHISNIPHSVADKD